MDRRHFLLAGSSLLPLYLAGCGGGNDGPQPAPSPAPPPPPPPPVRRDVTTLNGAERQQFIDTMYAMKRATSSYDPSTNAYDYFVKLHVRAFSGHANAHMCASFLPWHREMLMRFEKEMRKSSGNAQMSLPFWNWHQPKAHEKIFTNDFLGGNGDQLDGGLLKTGAFRVGVWALAANSDATPDEFADTDGDGIDDADTDHLPLTGLSRDFQFAGKAQTDLAFLDKYMSTQTVEKLMSIKNYDAAPYMESMLMGQGPIQGSDQWNSVSMRKTLERLLHNPVHACIGGQMGTGSSPNDPAFFLHHCNVDRLWDLWQAKYGNTTYPTSAQDKMVGSESTLDVYAEKIVISDTFDLLKHSGVSYQTSTVS